MNTQTWRMAVPKSIPVGSFVRVCLEWVCLGLMCFERVCFDRVCSEHVCFERVWLECVNVCVHIYACVLVCVF